MYVHRVVLGAMLAPVLFMGLEPAPALRMPARRTAEQRVSQRRAVRRRGWFIPLGGSAHADERVVPTRNDNTFTVEVVFLPREKVNERCAALGVWGANPVIPRGYAGGCNMYYLDRKHCVIIAPEPQFVDDHRVTVLGHELLHCARGRYHQ